MKAADYARLIVLAAIWGASFIFMRVAAPAFGTAWTAEGRLLVAALVLAAWFRFAGFDAQWRRHWKAYAAIGLVNLALPSLLYAFALRHVSASVGAVLNATAPMFGALLAAFFLAERFTARKAAGCICGIAGVVLVVGPGAMDQTPMFGYAVAACLSACLCYGYNGVLMRRYAPGLPSRGVAVGGQLAAALMLLPLLPFALPPGPVGALEISNLLALALLGNALGFVMYFRLISDVGATRALTVTYLMPLFAVLWGMLFLGESLPASALAGGVLILAGTVLVTRG
ncbi:MAG: DMT family transporter [Candidatus Parcubacteria bacterium]|nr:DMT family transporter [Burkholderiales bacterium]